MIFHSYRKHVQHVIREAIQSPLLTCWLSRTVQWQHLPYSGMITLLVGSALITVIVVVFDHLIITLPHPGLLYLPLVAMLAYHWGARQAIVAAFLQLACVYFFFLSPPLEIKPLAPQSFAQLLVLSLVTLFVLALVQLARVRRSSAEQAAQREAALHRVGDALTSELDETRLLYLIAQTARDLTGAEFAAFTLRPMDETGQPLVPAEGNRFRLAAIVGVTEEQERILQRMALGGEGLLAPIFRQGRAVRVADALALLSPTNYQQQAVFHHGQEQPWKESGLSQARRMPRGHPPIRSFLGAPLFDHARLVSGGLLLGHTEPGQFTPDDETLLMGLSAQAAIALENARLYRIAHMRAQELTATFDSMADGVTVFNAKGQVLRENPVAYHLRERLSAIAGGETALENLVHNPAQKALSGQNVYDFAVSIEDENDETRHYTVNAAPLCFPTPFSSPQQLHCDEEQVNATISGAVVVWHDVTEARRLLIERTAHKEADRLKDEFIGIAAHELRTPVAVLKGYAQMLIIQTARGKGPALTDWQLEALQNIDQATVRLIELIEDLLDVTRLQAGRLQLNHEATDLVALVRRVMMRMQMTTEQHILVVNMAVPYIIVTADTRRLEQVITNLLSNAIKYSPQGGMIEIQVWREEGESHALLSVRDHGIGIPQEQQARIFRRFSRAENAQAHGITGTGLGLYLCRGLIEQMEGRLWFESTEGEGSTFFLALPLIES